LTNVAANVIPNLTVFGQRLVEISPNEVHSAVYFWPIRYLVPPINWSDRHYFGRLNFHMFSF